MAFRYRWELGGHGRKQNLNLMPVTGNPGLCAGDILMHRLLRGKLLSKSQFTGFTLLNGRASITVKLTQPSLFWPETYQPC